MNSMMNSPLLSNDDEVEHESSSDFGDDEEKSSKIIEKSVESNDVEKIPSEIQNHKEENNVEDTNLKDEVQVSEIDIVDNGYKAVALYDYQACMYAIL